MAKLCLYFHMHQPYRMRRWPRADQGLDYFDGDLDQRLLDRVADRCYLPATRVLRNMVREHGGAFRLGLSITGCLAEQLRERRPEVLAEIQALVATGCVEILAETYHHSLSSLYSEEEFSHQIQHHAAMVHELFGVKPVVFRNTELIYDDALAARLAPMGYKGVLCEGVDRVLGTRSPNYPYLADLPAGLPKLKLLLRHYRYSDDIAFRFSNSQWRFYPLTVEKFLGMLFGPHETGPLRNLFMDFEALGEHQTQATGIFEFLRDLPTRVLAAGHGFATPSEAMDEVPAADAYACPQTTSWADTERDLSAWACNGMQRESAQGIQALEAPIKALGDAQLLLDWRRMTISDHYHHMCVKYEGDGAVHKYFRPYPSAFDAYRSYAAICDDLKRRVHAGQDRKSCA